MAARAKITMSPEEYLAGLKKLEAETNKSASKMENSFKEYGTSINKAGIAMRYVSAEMGAGAVAFVRAFQVLAGGKIAVAVAAITGALVGLKKIWDNLTVSAEEYKAKLDAQIESNDKNIESIRKTQKEEDTLLGKLEDLSKRDNKTLEEQDLQVELAEILAWKYKNLGISVQDLAGDYDDLLIALDKINEAQNKQKSGAIEEQVKALNQLIQTQFEENITPGFFGKIGSWFTFGKSTEQQADDFRSLTMREKRNAILQKRSEATNTDDIQKWTSMLSLIDKQIELQDRLNMLNKTGYETEIEEIDALEDEIGDLTKARREYEEMREKERAADAAYWKEQEEAERAAQRDLEKIIELEEKRNKAIADRQEDAKMDLKFAFMRMIGQSDKASIEQALYNEAKAQGLDSADDLNPDLAKDITKRTKAELALARLQNAQVTSPELYAPRVNSLIARGGSAAPMKLPKVEEYQAKTLSAVDKMAKDTGVIREYLKDNGLI